VLFAQGVGILFVVVSWYGIKFWRSGNKIWTSSPWWAILEIPTGFSFFFLFGAGFYAGPLAIMLAGLVRFGDFSIPNEPIQNPIAAQYTNNNLVW
tara:strand:+ start:188 stop:472 length:285 start_codon:yes stop_codon:yes gene_type:complete